MPRVTITVPEKTPQPYRFQLDRNSVTIGRGSDNDIPIDSGSISVKHAEMRRVPGGYELRDLGSTNGIKIYGSRHHVVQLRNGIPVKLGDVSFDFLLSDNELAELEFEKTDSKSTEKLVPEDKSQPTPPPPTDSTEESKSLKIEEEKPKAEEPTSDGPKDEESKDEESKDLESKPKKSPSGNNGCSGCAMILLFLILATAAFVAGMAIRFQKDTGDSLIDTIKAKLELMVSPAK